MNHEEYERRRLHIKTNLRVIREDMNAAQDRFDKWADELHALRREYAEDRRQEFMRQAEQESLDRD